MATSAAEALLKDGHIGAALAELKSAVRQRPADPKLRTFLFQILAVQGEWEPALNQLQVVGELDSLALPMVQTYREAIRCELLRRRVFTGESSPVAFGEPRSWFAMLVEALRRDASGQDAEAAALRAQAYEQAQPAAGRIDGRSFAWIADADTRLGPVLEVVMNGRYYWMPFDVLQRIEVEQPIDLRDVVWMPAHLVFVNGGDSVALIPTRYPDTVDSGNEQLMLARLTEWREFGEGGFAGVGQRIFATDIGEFSLMDVRELVFGTEANS
jgi:type VI secretion system protein ImpE